MENTFLYSNPENILSLSEGESDVWIEIIREGNWNNSYKQFEVGENHLSDFVKNFKANVLRYADKKIPLNYAHATYDKAAGWISELKMEGASLMGKVELTSDAREKIREGEWKYISAEISWEYTDQETGEATNNVLTGAALTNIPFVRDMKSVQASDAQGENQKENHFILLSDHDMTLEQQLADEKAKGTQLSEQLSAEKTKASELSEKLATAETKLSEAETAKKEAEEKLATAETKLSEAETAKKEAEEKLSEMLSQARTAKESARVDSLLSEGKILPAKKEETLSLLTSLDESQADAVFETLSNASAQVDLSGEEGGSDNGENVSAFSAYESFSKAYLSENENASTNEILSAFSAKEPKLAKQL